MKKQRRKSARTSRTSARKIAPKKRARAQINVTSADRAAGEWFARLVALQERLCAPNGCPWDREQSHATLRKYLIEETYEVLDAMESGDATEFAGELGDLLLQIVFHSVLAESAGTFTISDVIEGIYTKMVRRHPHVFGDQTAATSGAVLKKWEEIKAQERAAKRGNAAKDSTVDAGEDAAEDTASESVLSGVPRSLPAVLEAYQLTRRASHIGFDWENLQGIFEKIDEEKHELAELISQRPSANDRASIKNAPNSAKAKNQSPQMEEEVGDLLFAAVNVARFLGVDPEIALKKANRKFKSRFQWMENASQQEGVRLAEAPRDRMEQLWDAAKQALRK